MRALFIKASVLGGLFLVLAVAGNTQGLPQYRATIPFDFQIRNAHFAAGDYSLGPVGTHSSSGGVAIRARATGKGQIIGLSLLGTEESSAKGKLIFTKVNGTYTLTEVKTPAFNVRVPKSKRPNAMAMNKIPKTETVVVFLED